MREALPGPELGAHSPDLRVLALPAVSAGHVQYNSLNTEPSTPLSVPLTCVSWIALILGFSLQSYQVHFPPQHPGWHPSAVCRALPMQAGPCCQVPAAVCQGKHSSGLTLGGAWSCKCVEARCHSGGPQAAEPITVWVCASWSPTVSVSLVEALQAATHPTSRKGPGAHSA